MAASQSFLQSQSLKMNEPLNDNGPGIFLQNMRMFQTGLTNSRPIIEVKQPWLGSVLRWVTV